MSWLHRHQSSTDSDQAHLNQPMMHPQGRGDRTADYPGGADQGGGCAEYPMQVYNGLERRNPRRQAPQSDMDGTPRQFRRFVNASGAQEVQIGNGLRDKIATGHITGMPGEGYLYAVVPQMPGYRRTGNNAGGFHKRGPDPLSVFALYQAGPGSQPANPGGPGVITGSSFSNPMTG